jgi:NAD(P)H-dependent FMN reductase
MNISIISASIRDGRKSHRVALYFKNYLHEKGIADAEILDLDRYRFPLFEERLSYQKPQSASALEFAGKINSADGVIIVTPEYNGGYPASLKNVIDLLTREWYHKPVAVSTVSDGSFGGSQVIVSLQFILWKMKALVVPAMFPVSGVSKTFDESGNPADIISTGKRTVSFINELLWSIEAKSAMDKGK